MFALNHVDPLRRNLRSRFAFNVHPRLFKDVARVLRFLVKCVLNISRIGLSTVVQREEDSHRIACLWSRWRQCDGRCRGLNVTNLFSVDPKRQRRHSEQQNHNKGLPCVRHT